MARLRAKSEPASRARSGFRMPAEWEPHEATWLAWPHEKTDWPGKFAPIPWVYADIVRDLARVERVRILVRGRGDAKRHVAGGAEKERCESRARWIFMSCRRIADGFAISGRFLLKTRATDGETARLTNWRFNGWAKYDNWKRDDAATSRKSRHG